MYKLVRVQTPTGEAISDYAIRLSDGAFVYRTENQEYLKWLDEGNEPSPPDEPNAD